MEVAFKQLIPAGLVVLLAGCALQADLVDVETELRQVRVEQAHLKELVGGESRHPDQATATQRSLGELVIQSDGLANELQAIRGKLEQDSHLLSQLMQTMEEQGHRFSALDLRLKGLENRLAVRPGAPPVSPAVSPEVESAPTPEAGREGVVLPGRPPFSSLTPMEVYNLAYNDYLKGNYDLAVAGFRTFLQQFQDSALAPHAAYWLGESYYSKKQYLKAVETFDQVIKDFPKSEKMTGALLKKGLTYLKVGDKIQAEAALKRVIEEYPFSDEADLAKNKLAEVR